MKLTECNKTYKENYILMDETMKLLDRCCK